MSDTIDKDIAEVFSRYAANLTYESLPSEVVSVLKCLVLDTLGTTLAANTLGDGVQPLVALAREIRGSSESTLIGFGDKVPATMAALVNGGMAQALNYADTAETGGHLGPTSVPAALAAAEHVGKVSGKELLVALAAGAELLSRLSAGFKLAWDNRPIKPLRTQLWGYFSAAVSASRVMQLTAEEIHSALGLALMQASGTMQVVRGGDPPAKAIYAAFPNHAGVLSALLSRRGMRANYSAMFEGEAGLFAIYHEGRLLRLVLESDLGEKFYLLGARFKPWPTSGVVHPLIDAAVQLVERERLDVTAINDVHLRGGPELSHCCEPVELRKKPQTAAAAANSIFFPVAKVLVNGPLTLGDFTPSGLRQAGVLRLTERMSYSMEDDLRGSGIVEVTMATGERHCSRVDTPLGHGSKPLSYARLVEKFLDCAQYAAHTIPKGQLEEAIDLVENLERVSDVTTLPSLLKRMEPPMPT